mmetsp:Transcript_82574/g.133908  ORF Transcript_82574/g.133908 Transcript_82574/m.133908 type:complete len:169 (-) Transcript_82574:122-628(-)
MSVCPLQGVAEARAATDVLPVSLKRTRDLHQVLSSEDGTANTLQWAAHRKRQRLQPLNKQTLLLLQQLEQHVELCVSECRRKDQAQRAESKRIAGLHPLTFPTAMKERSVSPYFSAANSPTEPNTTVCKDTPCLAPTPIFSTPNTIDRSQERLKSMFGQPLEPPLLSI